MLISALLDAGLQIEDLERELALLPVGGFEISASKTRRGGIEATLLDVKLTAEGERHRDWQQFESAIRDSGLPDADKTTALKVFDLLADAESTAHGAPKEHVHLHELGTIDTLMDVAGVIAGLRLMGIERVHASPFPLSSGTSRSSHGVMAATAAATAAIYRQAGAPVKAGGQFGPRGEAVTPTGAALLATIATFNPVSFVPEVTGHGAGARDPEDYPNVVGLWIGEATESPSAEAENDGLKSEGGLWKLETNIDDMTPEALAHAQSRLLEAGALDVWLTPALMKKGRPATELSALVRGDDRSLAESILRETSTLGVRRMPVERYVADREIISVSTPFSDVRVKIKRIGGAVAGTHPEFEDCQAIARERGVSLREVTESAVAEARRSLGI